SRPTSSVRFQLTPPGDGRRGPPLSKGRSTRQGCLLRRRGRGGSARFSLQGRRRHRGRRAGCGSMGGGSAIRQGWRGGRAVTRVQKKVKRRPKLELLDQRRHLGMVGDLLKLRVFQ